MVKAAGWVRGEGARKQLPKSPFSATHSQVHSYVRFSITSQRQLSSVRRRRGELLVWPVGPVEAELAHPALYVNPGKFQASLTVSLSRARALSGRRHKAP